MDRRTIEYNIEQKKKEIKKMNDLKIELTNGINQFVEKCNNMISDITSINSVLDYSKDTMISPDIKEKNANIVSKITNKENMINSKKASVTLKIDNRISSLQNEINSLNHQLSNMEE